MQESPKPKKLFRDFIADEPTLVRALDLATKFVADIKAHPFRDGYCLTLAGKSGTGKTMLANAILAELGLDAWGECIKISPIIIQSSLQKFTGRFFDIRKISDGFKNGQWGAVDAMEETWLSILDDVGADHDPSKITVSKIDRVLRTRKERGRWTLVTVNLPLDEIGSKLDSRIASFVIRDDNKFLEIKSDDFAKRKFRKAP